MNAWLGWLTDGVLALVTLGLRGEQIGWAFYRAAMRRAERRMLMRDMARTELAQAIARTALLQAQLHAHAHTMAGLTGQAYLVSRDHVLPVGQPGNPVPVHVPELIVPLAWLGGDPRHQPWQPPLADQLSYIARRYGTPPS